MRQRNKGSGRRRVFVGLVATLIVLACAAETAEGKRPRRNRAPTVTVTAPATDLEVQIGTPVTVVYADKDRDSVASTDLFADGDGNLGTTGDQVVIAANRPERNGASQTVIWHTTGALVGTYRIVARTDDGVNAPVTATAPGRVTLREAPNVPPTVEVTSPDADLDLEIGALVSIAYRDDDEDDVASTDLLADRDGDLATTDDQVVVASDRPEQDGATQNVVWDTTGVTAGTYSILARTDDGVHDPVTAAAPGRVTLTEPPPPPPPAAASPVGDGHPVPAAGLDERCSAWGMTWGGIITFPQLTLVPLGGGAPTILYSSPTPTLVFSSWPGLAHDVGRNRAMFFEQGPAAGGTTWPPPPPPPVLVAVDLATGVKVAITNAAAGPTLNPAGLAFDAARDRALVSHLGTPPAIYAVDVVSGTASVLSDAATGTGPALGGPGAIALDAAAGRAYVIDAPSTGNDPASVLAVHVISGNRSLVSGPTRGRGPDLNRIPTDMTLDTVRRVAFVTQTQLGAVLAVDLVTGERVVVSR